MPNATDAAIPEQSAADGEEGELDGLKEQARLFLRAPRRHPRLAGSTVFCVLLAGLAVAIFAPRWYRCEARILAQRNLVLPALGNPNRAPPREGDSPAKNAADAILARGNLVTLVKQLDLVDRWQATRQPVQRLKDTIVSHFGPARSDDDRLMDMVGFLEKQVAVGSDDSSITISIEWPDRDLAFEIVAFLQQRFLQSRHDASVAVVQEAIRILDERAKPLSAEVDAALADLTRVEAERRDALAGRAPAGAGMVVMASPASVARPPSGHPDDEVTEQLEDVRHRIHLAREDRQRQLLQAQSQLADARATLGPMHPTMLALRDKIRQLSESPADVQALVARERQLMAQTSAHSGPGAAASPAAAPPPRITAAAPARGKAVRLTDDPQVAQALSRLQGVSAKYDEMLSRIEAANIELEVTRAAFKYQYAVVRPAEMPRRPSRPDPSIVALLSLLGAALLAVLVPGGLDLLRGRFVEPWQLGRRLDLPLLGELTTPR